MDADSGRYVLAAFVIVRYVAVEEASVRYASAASEIFRYVDDAVEVDNLLLNVFQSVAERVPVADVPDRANVSAWPEIVSPFVLFARVTSPVFVPLSFAPFNVELPITRSACEVVEIVNPVVVVARARPLYERTFAIDLLFRFTFDVAPVYGI